jgi:hypothetical protein
MSWKRPFQIAPSHNKHLMIQSRKATAPMNVSQDHAPATATGILHERKEENHAQSSG